jgi:hypothetical protein
MPFSPLLAPLLPAALPEFDPLEVAGPFLLPGAPCTPGPELVEELFILVSLELELSAAIAGAMPINVTTAQALRIFFMAFPSLLFCLLVENAALN